MITEGLHLTSDELEMLIQKREEAGADMAGLPSEAEAQRVKDLRAAKAAKQRGGQNSGFDIDTIKLGMSKEVRDRAKQEILKHFRTT